MLPDEILSRFGRHRRGSIRLYGGNRLEATKKENTLVGIKDAISERPPFVEFDVIKDDNGIVRLGHEGLEFHERFKNVIPLFEGEGRPYPKVDCRVERGHSHYDVIDAVLNEIVKYNIKFALISIGRNRRVTSREDVMQAELYLARNIRECQRDGQEIRLNIDLAKYRPPGEEIDDGIRAHLLKLGGVKSGGIVYSISLEIHEEDWEIVIETAIKYGIPALQPWLKGRPDVSDPSVKEETILRVYELEKSHPVEVYFDINPGYVI